MFKHKKENIFSKSGLCNDICSVAYLLFGKKLMDIVLIYFFCPLVIDTNNCFVTKGRGRSPFSL